MPDNKLLRRRQARAERQRADEHADSDAAAKPKASGSERPSARTMLVDFMRPNRSQVVFAVILFVTALLLVTGIQARNAEPDFSTLRRADLVQMLDTLSSDSRKLASEIADLERTKQQLESGVNSAQVAQAEAKRRLDTMRILAGTAPAEGPGIRMTIFDPQNKVGPELVLDAVEEMRDAGAEVIAINPTIRVVANTWFGRDANGGLIIDGHAVSFPLVIEVIGDPATLDAGARFRGGLVSEVSNDRVGGSVSIQQVDRLRVTAVATPGAPQYSRPA